MVKRVKHDLVALKQEVLVLLETIGEGPWSTDRERIVRGTLEQKGAHFDYTNGATQVTYAGVRASATIGPAGALRNWIKAANRRLDRQALAKMGGQHS